MRVIGPWLPRERRDGTATRNEGAPASKPDSRDPSPYLLSRDYEDHLDWLENQRRSRTNRGRGRWILGTLSAFATAFSLAGAMMRRR